MALLTGIEPVMVTITVGSNLKAQVTDMETVTGSVDTNLEAIHLVLALVVPTNTTGAYPQATLPPAAGPQPL
jgi:hypothetical protein